MSDSGHASDASTSSNRANFKRSCNTSKPTQPPRLPRGRGIHKKTKTAPTATSSRDEPVTIVDPPSQKTKPPTAKNDKNDTPAEKSSSDEASSTVQSAEKNQDVRPVFKPDRAKDSAWDDSSNDEDDTRDPDHDPEDDEDDDDDDDDEPPKA